MPRGFELGISELLFSDYKWTPFCLLLVIDLYLGMVVISFSNKVYIFISISFYMHLAIYAMYINFRGVPGSL